MRRWFLGCSAAALGALLLMMGATGGTTATTQTRFRPVRDLEGDPVGGAVRAEPSRGSPARRRTPSRRRDAQRFLGRAGHAGPSDLLEPVRILLWHGYLLGGTGSNVYTRQVAREWRRAGHDVTVVCQERHPEELDLGGAAVVRPELPGGILPVFVLDRYEGLDARRLPELTRGERERFVEANAAALRALAPADLVFANHVLLGAPVGAASGLPFAVKAHGSELEYSMRGNAGLADWARESLAGARATFVGSAHIRAVLEDVVGRVERVHEVPPGVDVEEFRPRPRGEALAALLDEARRDPPNPGNANERLPDEGNAARLEAFLARRRADGRLLREADRAEGRAPAARGAARARCARASSSASATTARELEAQRRRASSSPGRSSTATSSSCCRSPTPPSCRRSSPRRSGWSPPRPPPRAPAARRAPLRAGRGRGGDRGGATRRTCARSSRSSAAARPTCGGSSKQLLALDAGRPRRAPHAARAGPSSPAGAGRASRPSCCGSPPGER